MDNRLMKKQKGVTLIELIVTMTIITITLFVGIPSLQQLVKNNEIVNQSNTIASFIAYARSEATKRKSNVRICRGKIVEETAECASTGNNLLILNNNDTLIRTAELSSNINFYFQNLASSTITFSAQGIPDDTGEIVLCDDRGASFAKGVALNLGGQVRSLVKSEINKIVCS